MPVGRLIVATLSPPPLLTLIVAPVAGGASVAEIAVPSVPVAAGRKPLGFAGIASAPPRSSWMILELSFTTQSALFVTPSRIVRLRYVSLRSVLSRPGDAEISLIVRLKSSSKACVEPGASATS